MADTKQKFTRDSIIGDVLRSSAAAEAVIKKYFGNGCFTCSGINVENIGFGAMMHNIDPEVVVKELNDLED